MGYDVLEENIEDNIVLHRMEIFPLDMTISVGKNSEFYPVISDAIVSLRLFQRLSTSGNINSIFSSTLAAYIAEAYSELYKIIADLDLLTSPLQNGRKFLHGLKDFVMYPLESLVLDDTPGAFMFGVARGTKSFLLNTTDVLFTMLMKLFSSLSWSIHALTFDPEYREQKYRVAQQHPRNFAEGLKLGFYELGRGVVSGLIGVFERPFTGASKEGFLGFLKGVGQGLIGLPLKPIGGSVEFVRILLESVLK